MLSTKLRTLIRQQWAGLIAIFIALSGTAYAVDGPLAGQNTVGSADIINSEVQEPDIKAGAVRSSEIAADTIQTGDIGGGAVHSADVANDSTANALKGIDVAADSLGGPDIDESRLDLAAEDWHELLEPGEPVYNDSGFCAWGEVSVANNNTGAFLRDPHGFVHLKGLVDADDSFMGACDFTEPGDKLIYNLPEGYRPAKREVHATLTNGALGRVTVDGPELNPTLGAGAVSVDDPTTAANALEYVSLDGISFRCAPSGVDGCP
jgi:hypothetical protein